MPGLTLESTPLCRRSRVILYVVLGTRLGRNRYIVSSRSIAVANTFMRQASTLKPLVAICTPLGNEDVARSQFLETSM